MDNTTHHWKRGLLVLVACLLTLAFLLAARPKAVVGTPANRQFSSAPVSREPGLSLVKGVLPSVDLPLGGIVTYTIMLGNDGDSDALGVTMTDVLPIEVDFGGWVSQSGALQIEDTITWTGSVSAETEVVVAFTASVGTDPEYLGRTVTNTASFSSTNASGGSSYAVFTVVGPPNLHSSTKISSVHQQVEPGDLVTYTVTLRNTGDWGANALVTDTLGFYYTVYDEMDFDKPFVGILTWSGTVAAHDEVTLHFVAQVVARSLLPMGQTILRNEAQLDDRIHQVLTIEDPSPPWVNILSMVCLPVVMKDHFGDPYEPNDTFDQAHGSLVSGYPYNAYFPTENDVNDYYYIDVSTTSLVRVQLAVPDALDLDMWVYDGTQTLVGGSAHNGYGVDEQFEFTPATTGKFYILIHRYAGWSTAAPYTLKVTFN